MPWYKTGDQGSSTTQDEVDQCKKDFYAVAGDNEDKLNNADVDKAVDKYNEMSNAFCAKPLWKNSQYSKGLKPKGFKFMSTRLRHYLAGENDSLHLDSYDPIIKRLGLTKKEQKPHSWGGKRRRKTRRRKSRRR